MTEHAATPHSADSEHPMGHVMPMPVLVGVFLALLVLTFLTVAAAWVDLGPLNLWIALGIATVKATLVALFFMHLLYDNRFNAFVFVVGLAFLALFISLTLMDRGQYQPDIERFNETQPLKGA